MIIPGIFVFIMWLVKLIEILFDIDLSRLGIYPLTLQGLPGIFFSPFIHADFEHLFSNSFPLFFLSLCVFYFYSEVAMKVFIWTYLLTGFFVWIAERSLAHWSKRPYLRSCVISVFQWYNSPIFQAYCIIILMYFFIDQCYGDVPRIL